MSDCSSPLSSIPSSPLSMRSRSPTPPFGYPSPSSTQQSGSRASSKSHDLNAGSMDVEGPPTKKRKLAEPKKRTTEYLDLRGCNEESKAEDEIQLQRLLKALHTKQKIVIIAGAGISVSAGIPDFRSSTGLFNTLKSQNKLKGSGKQLFDASVYRSNDSTTSFHDMVRELSHLTRNAEPTPFHHLIATLAEEGRLLRLYSQNVDGIDTSLPPLATNVPLNPKGPWPKTIQLHGGLEKMVCTKCGTLSKFDGALFEGPEPPSCPDCVAMDHTRTTIAGKRSHGIGRLRPRMVLYNEFNPDEEAIGAVSAADLKSRPDAVIVVGTSMKIPGLRRLAREMCWVTRGRRDGFAAWINLDPEPLGIDFKDCWDLVVRAPCDDIATYAGLPKYDEKDVGDYQLATMDDVIRAKSKGDVQIHLPQHKALDRTAGIVTPTASPRRQSITSIDVKNIPPIRIQLPGTKITISNKKGAPKKPRKSKKGQPTKAANPITSSFNVTKSTKVDHVKQPYKKQPKDEIPDSSSPIPAPIFPNLSPSKTPSKRTRLPDAKPSEPHTPIMRPVSKTDLRANSSDVSAQLYSEMKLYSHVKEDRNVEARHDGSSSPYDQESFDAARKETVSPRSKPRGLDLLID